MRTRPPTVKTRLPWTAIGIAMLFVAVVGVDAQPQEPPWQQTGGPTGAPMRSVAIDPSNPRVIYASGPGGGVYKSTDGGDSWHLQPIANEYGAQSAFHSLQIDPSETGTVYVAGGGGIFRTTDGGRNWRTANTGIRVCHPAVQTLVMHPENPDVLYAGTYSHCPDTIPGAVYKTTDGGENWTNITGQIALQLGEGVRTLSVSGDEVYAGLCDYTGQRDGQLYHSRDAGRSWSRVDFGQPRGTYIYSVFVDPSDPAEVWVGVNHNENVRLSSCLFLSRDSGRTWAPVGTFPETGEVLVHGKSSSGAVYVNRFRSPSMGATWELYFPEVSEGASGTPGDLAFHPTNASMVYAALAWGSGVARSADGGRTWQRCDEGITNTSVSLLAAHPSDPDVLLAAAVSGEGTFRTTDGGGSWAWVTGNGITHPYADEVAFRPNDPTEAWSVADVGKVFVSHDSGLNWTMTMNATGGAGGNGFRFGSVYALAVAPTDPDVIYALKNGFSLYRSRDGGNTWTFLRTSEVDYSYSIAVHPKDPDTIYAGFLPKPFQDFGMVRRSFDGGDTWDTALTVPNSRGITSVAIDSKQPDTVYATSVGDRAEIYKSVNQGGVWTRLNEQFTMLTVWGQSQLAVDPLHSSVLYATTWLGGTWKTEDAGRTWVLLSDAPASGTSLCVDPQNPTVVYLSDRTSPKVWRSTDAGATWAAIADFSAEGAFLVNRVLADGRRLLAATFEAADQGHGGRLYESEDSGMTWRDITGTLPRSVLDVAIDPRSSGTLYVTTHIHGAFKSSDGGGSWTEMTGFPDIGAYDIEVDPEAPQILYACGLGGQVPSWCMLPEGHTFRDAAGVYKSTDAGETWARVLQTSNECRAIRIHPLNHMVLFAAAMDDGLQVSSDGGSTWTSFNEGLGTRVLTSCAIGEDKVYVGTQGCGVYSGDVRQGSWRVSWDAVRSNKPVPTVHSLQIQVDPSNSRRIFVGANPGGLFRSDDGGATFYDKNFLTPSVIVSDPHRQGYYAFALDPADPAEVWLGTWGKGIYKSYDGMDFDVGASGMNRTMFGKHVHALLVDSKRADTVYVATEEGVFRTTDGGTSWTDYSAGLGTRQVRTLAMTATGLLLAGTLGYELYRVDPGSQKPWAQLGAFGIWGYAWPIWNDRPAYQYTSLLFHPTDPNIVYFGTFPAGIFVSRDGGGSWRESNPGWPNDGVFTLTFRPGNADVIYSGTYNGLMISSDAGAHWEVRDEGWPAEQWVFSIAFAPDDPSVMYACSKNGENEGTGRDGFHGTVMKSIDGGRVWTPVTHGLDLNQEFYKVLVDPEAPSVLYLATQRDGVFASRNSGASWSSWNTGLTNLRAGTNGNNVTSTMSLSADGKWIYFGTAGSGVFRRPTIGAVTK